MFGLLYRSVTISGTFKASIACGLCRVPPWNYSGMKNIVRKKQVSVRENKLCGGRIDVKLNKTETASLFTEAK